MKIGIYSGSIPSEVFIENLISGLSKNGYKVYVYGKPKYYNYKTSNSYIIKRGFSITKIGTVIYFIYQVFRLIIKKPTSFISIIRVIRNNSDNLNHFINRSSRILPPILDDLDVFHIQWAKMLLQYPEIIEKINCPIILSLRGTHINVSPLSNNKLALAYEKYFSKINGIHAVSRSIAKEAEKYGVKEKEITIINPAVKKDLLSFKINKINEKGNNIINILSVGRCHWIKGYTFALDAMSILKKENIKFHYTIIASGDDQENLNYQIDDLGLQDDVTFINGAPHSETIIKISKSNLFLLPSLGEGISNSVLEAMALGVPVISSNCGGMTEVITHDYNGFIYSARDYEEIPKLIKYFIGLDQNSIHNIIKNAKNTIKQNFLIQKQIKSFIDLYDKVK